MSAAEFAAWRSHFLHLLLVARLGSQFPDAARWRALLELLARTGPRGRPLRLARGAGGLPTPRALGHLHQLQRIAREFLAAHRLRPTLDARAFSSALAAVELPVVSETRARLMAPGKRPRLQVVHEQLGRCAVRFTITLEQHKGSHLRVGRDQLVQPSDGFLRTVREACSEGAAHARRVLAAVPGLVVLEVQRGQLGPLITTRSAPEAAEVAALRALVRDGQDAVLSVGLERCGVELNHTALLDPWLAPEPLDAGQHLARERRLFCTPALEAPLRALVSRTGAPVLIRAR